MRLLDTDRAQAVLFFDKDGITKELLYTEFEALLEGFVPIDEWINSRQKAVYVEFNHQFSPTAAVFFYMQFNGKGHVDAAWNLPLFDLARTATKGPDLGAGPIHLTCATHCPIAYFQNWLWDPDAHVKTGHFEQIKKALKRNRLGVHFKPTEPNEGKNADALRQMELRLAKEYETELRTQLAQLLKDQQQAHSGLDRDALVKEVRQEYAQKMEELQQSVRARESALADAERRNYELKATIDGQVQKIEGLREYFEHKLQRFQIGDGDLAAHLKAQYQAEAEAKANAAVKELTELLKIKQVELGYRQEHEEQLQRELDQLKQENKELLENGGDHLLDKLSRKGINFVTYQPGAGHITIPLAEISFFLESSSAFTAAYCGVSEPHYQAWLKHYHAPVCCVAVGDDDLCAVDLTRVIDPVQFVPGDSDVCDAHKKHKPSVAAPRSP